MLGGHPKGLLVAFFSNMGERFGFYTMMAILVFFLQVRYGLAENDAGIIYSVFYFLIYALALVGGYIADRTQNYKGTIMVGLIIMFCGYLVMAIPNMPLPIVLVGLFAIAFGNGLFKGNLQAVVGQMYDQEEYKKLRDSAYSIFYMGINIGAMFAPNAAKGIRNFILERQGFLYDQDLPALCHQLKSQTITSESLEKMSQIVQKMGGEIHDLSGFAERYLDAFSIGYNYAFGIAGLSMLVSLAVYLLFRRYLPERDKMVIHGTSQSEDEKTDERKRLVALGLIFLVVIFFWMSFHQNGLTMNYLARDYTAKEVGRATYYLFDIRGLLCLASIIIGLVFLLQFSSTNIRRVLGFILVCVGGIGSFLLLQSYDETRNPIEAEVFQQFNPFFVVFLTPVVVYLFSFLRQRNVEPSTPMKITIGMCLAALAFFILMLGSLGLPSPNTLQGQPSPVRISPYWLISSYFLITVAELFLSPMGLSFVSKVAPKRFQGLMQGGWLGATALGNQLLFVGSSMWVVFDLCYVWLFFIICCLISAGVMFMLRRHLEEVAR